ncbi:hypothetical protein GGF46_003382, partial [Coemansia sp. RSA 552]
MNPETATETNRNFMKAEVEERLSVKVAKVVDQAQPRDDALRAHANRLTEHIWTNVQRWRRALLKSTPKAMPDFGSKPHLEPMYDDFVASRGWLKGGPFSREVNMYSPMAAFIRMVARFVKDDVEESAGAYNLVLPFQAMNSKPGSSADDNLVDIALGLTGTGEEVKPLKDLDYSSIFAVIEVKRTKPGYTHEAQKAQGNAQLFDYSRQEYTNQIDRRFVWGLTCVDTMVYASLFNNYKVFESPAMDVTTDDGCREFIRLLVGWSFCSWRQLGYDETISWDASRRCYAIQVPSTERDGEPQTYYSETAIAQAHRLFGRHCRIILATSTPPPRNRSPDSVIEADTVIKDTWVMYTSPKDGTTQAATSTIQARRSATHKKGVASKEVKGWPAFDFDPYGNEAYCCLRSEFVMLKRIGDALDNDADLTGCYPKLKHGGWVYQPLSQNERKLRGNADRVLDSTRDIVGRLDKKDLDNTSFCVHMRVAITPVGRSLGSLTAVGDLIRVLYDAMRAHMEMFRECGIIHRDISYNNILAVRRENRVRGALIDLDCAWDMCAQDTRSRMERTGTFPFMSVVNLEKLDVQRTILDDWEALLYLICVIGTYGPRMERRDGENLPITA